MGRVPLPFALRPLPNRTCPPTQAQVHTKGAQFHNWGSVPRLVGIPAPLPTSHSHELVLSRPERCALRQACRHPPRLPARHLAPAPTPLSPPRPRTAHPPPAPPPPPHT